MSEDNNQEHIPIGLIIFLLVVIIGLVSLIAYMMFRSKQKPWYLRWGNKDSSLKKSANQLEKRFSHALDSVGDTISGAYVDARQYFRRLNKKYSSKKPTRYSSRK